MIDRAALDLLLDGVDGYLHADEPAFLAALAAQVPADQGIVEIGSFRGRSTIALAYGAPAGVIVYAVDPHDDVQTDTYTFGMADNQAFMSNISRAGLGAKVRVVNLPSKDALVIHVRHAIGLVFIDGAHDYQNAKFDALVWGNALKRGGLLALHDSNGTWADPTRVADEQRDDPAWTEIDGCGYTRVFRKDSE